MAVIPANRRRNAIWPLQRDAKGWVTGSMGPRYTAAVHHLLRTPLGSYPWEPTYGTRIHYLRTQSITEADQGFLQADVASAMNLWIPDIILIKVEVQLGTIAEEEDMRVIATWGIPNATTAGARADSTKFALGPVVQTITI